MWNKLLSIYYVLRNHYWLWVGHTLVNRQSPTCQPVIHSTGSGYWILGCSRHPLGYYRSCPYLMDSPHWQILY